MRRTTCIGAFLLLCLSACGPTSYQTYVKPGASSAAVSRAASECNVEANQLFPSAVFTSSTIGYGGYYGGWGGSYVQASDVNAGMRNEHRRDCMILKGYTPVRHPICTQQQTAGRSYRPVPAPLAPAPNICALRSAGGGLTLIDLNQPV